MEKSEVEHIDKTPSEQSVEKNSTAQQYQDEEDSYSLKIAQLKDIIGENREEQEKKFLLKLDFRMLPMLMVIYILNYLDRTNIATARLDGLEKDTGLKGTQYNTIISIFYIGYVLTQVFTNAILNRTRPSILLPLVMVCWALVSACAGAVKSFGGWIAVRLILGVVESPYFAGAIFLLSSWYTKRELSTRISIMYTASQMSNAFGGLIGQAILNRFQTDNRGLEAWRWLFIIEGSITVPFAILAMFILPDFPHNTKFFNEKERAIAQLRMLEDAGREEKYEESLLDGFKAAFTDPTLYMLWIMQLCLVTAATVNTYFPTIVGTLGYNRTKTLLLTAPPWFFSAFFSCFMNLHSDKTNERFWHILISLVVALVGFIMAISTMQIAVRYVSMFLMLGIYAAFNGILGWVATCISRPPPKRAVSYAFINAFSNVSSVYASYFYPSSTGPRYTPAMAANIAFTAVSMITAVVLNFYLRWRNKKLDTANELDYAREGTQIGSETQKWAKKFDCPPAYRFTL